LTLTLEQYGIKLKRLAVDDIELLRKWRNHPKIRKRMNFKKYISKEMQLDWFNSIDNTLNYYFLIEYRGHYIGVIDNKKINLKERTAEGGIFIWEEELDNELVPIFASLCLLNAICFRFDLLRKSFVQILKSNQKAIAFNKQLGYSLLPGQEKNKSQWYLLTKEDYLEKTKKIRQVAAKLTQDFENPRIYGAVSDKNLAIINNYLEKTK
jgi:hypothetical protein